MTKRIVSATINGELVEVLAEPYETLLEVLRNEAGLIGSKEGCGNGNCGACNVVMNGQLVNSCGICTPGFIVAAKALLDVEPNADEARIRHWLAGNLCRCTGYDKIIRAVQVAQKQPAGA